MIPTTLLLAAVLAPPLPTPYRWDISATGGIQGGAGTWSTGATNWTQDGGTTRVVWPANARAEIGGEASGAAGTITLSGTVNVDELISNTPFSGTYTIATNQLVLTGRSRITTNAALTISSSIGGSAGLKKYGAATLTVSGTQANTGGWLIYEGTIVANASPQNTHRITLANTSGAAMTVGTTLVPESIHGGGTSGGNIALGGNQISLTTTTSDANFAGILSGTGTLTKNGAGTQTLSGANTSTCLIENNLGTLNFNGTSSGAHTNFYTKFGAVTNIGGVLSVVDWYANNGSSSNGTVNINSGGTLNVSGLGLLGQNATSTFICNIASGGLLAVTGSQFIVANTAGAVQTGTLNIAAGGTATFSSSATTLLIGNSNSLATVNLEGLLTSARTITSSAAGSIWNFNGGTLRAGFSSTGFFTSIGRCNIRNGGAVIDTNGFNITAAQALLHSNIGGDNAIDGGVTKIGTGTATLSGSNSYTGPTTLTAGTLAAPTLANGGANSSIGASTNAASNLVFAGGALEHTGGTQSTDRSATVAGGNGTIKRSGTTGTLTWSGGIDVQSGRTLFYESALSSSYPLTMSGVLSGAGAFTNQDYSEVILSNTNTLTGGITVAGGIGGGGFITVTGSTHASCPVTSGYNGQLRGTGTINGPCVVQSGRINGGTGNGTTGTLTLAGTLTFATPAGPTNRIGVTTNGAAAVSQITQTLASQTVDVTGVVVTVADQNLDAGVYTIMTLGSGSTFTGTGAMGTHIKPDNRTTISVYASGNLLLMDVA